MQYPPTGVDIRRNIAHKRNDTKENTMGLKDMRKAAGLSQHKLSERAGVPLSNITVWEAWESGRKTKTARNPRLMRLDTAARMADALGVGLGEFYENLGGALR